MTQSTPTSNAAGISAFLSYSREDRPRAQAIVKALEQRGIRVWWDGLIEGGKAFSDRIETALASADAVIVLWSAHSVQSHWVRDEAANGRDRQRLIPVTLDGSEPPLGFRQLQLIDLSKSRGKPASAAMEQLVAAVTALATDQPVPRIARRKAAPVSRRSVLALAGTSAVVLAGGFAAWELLGGSKAEAMTVGVLPFRNIGGDSAEDYFSDGLAEELRATLSQDRRLEVAARTSSEKTRDAPSALSSAKALGVRYLVDGSVRRSPDMVRITARIVDGRTGFDKWSQSFDRKLDNILAVQSEVADFVTDALLGDVVGTGGSAGARIGGTTSAAALDSYLRGVALYQLANGKQTDFGALAAFDQAVALDPHYALAHAARSRALTVIANSYASHAELRGYYDKAVAAARTAIADAPDLADGYSALGFVLINGELDVRAARDPYQRSFDLGFGNADLLSSYANFAGHVGDFDQGRQAIARAQRLDPLNATVFRNAGLMEYAAHNFDAAASSLDSALSMNPKSSNIRVTIGDIHLLKGDAAAARAAYALEPDDIGRLRGLAIADRRLGQAASADADFAQLTAQFGDIAIYQQAQVFAQWGDQARALDALERALAAGDAGLVLSKNDPLLDPIRKDRRFEAVQRTMGFV